MTFLCLIDRDITGNPSGVQGLNPDHSCVLSFGSRTKYRCAPSKMEPSRSVFREVSGPERSKPPVNLTVPPIGVTATLASLNSSGTFGLNEEHSILKPYPLPARIGNL